MADLVLVAAVLAGVGRGRPRPAAWLLGAASLWLAGIVCWRASDWALVTALPASVVTLAALALVAARRIRVDRFDQVSRASLDALRELPAGLIDAAKMPAVALEGRARAGATQIVRGALVGLPIAAFLALLLAADRSFADAVEGLFIRSGEGVELALWTAGTSAAVLLASVVLRRLQRSAAVEVPSDVLFAAVPYRVEGDRPAFSPPPAASRPRLAVLTWSVVLLQLVVVFGVYVAANARTSFAGHALLQARGTMTYSQYVHEGFAQVAAATLFAVACVVAGHTLLRAQGAGRLPGGKGLAAVELTLLALVSVTLASSVHRLALYEEAYGYT